MTVGISMLTLVPAAVGGSETYALNLIRALARVGTLEYRVFLPTIASSAADGLPAETVTAYAASRRTTGRIVAMARAALFPRPIRAQIEPQRLDAIHYPLTVTLPRLAQPPAVTTVHDIQHVLFPRFFSCAELAYRRVVYGWAVRAPRVIVPSEHVQGTLVERLRVDPGRIRVVHLGIDHERFRPGDAPREPFVLYPANRWPHKNHERLFDAFRHVRRARPHLRLVLTGSGHEETRAPEDVDVRGRVTTDELARLYRRASALVFPSLYEGFGQPPLEAMASGCPVAASRAGSLLEVCGDAARFFDPESVEEIADAVLDVVDRPDEWSARGLARAAAFGWDECARRHEAVYREVAGRDDSTGGG